MTNKRIHIVSFDVPFEPNYGGILDVYLRAKALKEVGFHVIMHCFDYGRGDELNTSEIASEVIYYKRNTSVFSLVGKAPFIVRSRANAVLLENLLKVNDPILLEGQHCSAFAEDLRKAGKTIAIRMHNVEWQYYAELSKRESMLFKRRFFKRESRKLKLQEKELLQFPLLCISKTDLKYYTNLGAKAELAITPLFFDPVPVANHEKYALYHGNLSVNENVEALEVLMDKIRISESVMPVKVAGKQPGPELESRLKSAGIECIPNPGSKEMKKLINGAAIHLCIGFQRSGLKLKLLQSLKTGKPCIVTREMLFGTELEPYCIVWDPKDKQDLNKLIAQVNSFTPAEIESRKEALQKIFAPENYVKIVERTLFAL